MKTIDDNPDQLPQTDVEGSSPAPSRLSGWALVALVSVAVVLGIVIYSGIRERAHAETALGVSTERAAVPVVNIVHPVPAAPTQEIVLPGDTQPFDDTPIYARTNGYLRRWYVDIGAQVKQGQLLAEIDTPEIDQQLEQARADLKNAQANEQLAQITAARWQNLLKTNSVSKQETDQAVSDLSARQANVDSMTANVHRLEQLQSFEKVYAPFSGVITARNTDIGALINAGAGSAGTGAAPQELFHMAAVDKLRVYVAVPEIDSRAAQTGARATLTLDEYPGETFEGTIVRNSDAIDSASRTLNVEVDVDNRQSRIKTGSYVFVHLRLPQSRNASAESLTIPANTLLFRSEGLRVGVVREGHAQLVPITIGRDFGSTVEVVAGLQPEDQVIVNPSDSLTSGSSLRVSGAEPEGVQ
ncbi:MAG TPA: efflux RND transporter periplasmic adaptor subunit [Acidobacteriaceae bacterium]|jgi:RND family efflux transporter MFP subunit|nr:efflux RND transporter periplasmic adaptor subunit [Acidobacteriaceae bacterium]